MSSVLCKVQRMIEDGAHETNDAINLLFYLDEAMTEEIYAQLKKDKSDFIRTERVDMMFTLLYTALKKLDIALKIQRDTMDYIQGCREGEKEKVPARAATQAEGQKQN